MDEAVIHADTNTCYIAQLYNHVGSNVSPPSWQPGERGGR